MMAQNRKSYLDSRQDLERRVFLVSESLRQNKMKFSSSHTITSLKNVKALANKRVALFTVNGIVRSLALTIEGMDSMKKNTSHEKK